MAKGKLVKWTKGFSCSGCEGRDVVELLQEAIQRRGDVKIEVCAILNDTTGCLMSCAWRDERCRIGLILGTGTNACYLEEIKDIHTIDQKAYSDKKYMVINTEWGAFGDNGELDFVVTKWDRAVDEMSVNPGKQIFEKMISGMYMGELIRQVIVDLMKDDLIFFNWYVAIFTNTVGNFSIVTIDIYYLAIERSFWNVEAFSPDLHPKLSQILLETTLEPEWLCKNWRLIQMMSLLKITHP